MLLRHYSIHLLLLLTFFNAFAINEKKTDSLENILKALPAGTSRVKILNLLSSEYRNSKPDIALKYCEEAIALAEKIDDKTGLVYGTLNKAIILQNESQFAPAAENMLKALHIADKIGDSALISKCYNSLGTVYALQEQRVIALEYFGKALEIFSRRGDLSAEATVLNNIGNIHYYNSFDIEKNDFNLDSLRKAIDFYERSLRIKEKTGDSMRIVTELNNLGLIYTEFKDYKRAEAILQRSERICIATENKLNLVYSLANLCRLYGSWKKDSLFHLYKDKTLALAKQVNDKSSVADLYGNLSEYYAEKGDYKTAYNHHVDFYFAKYELINEENNRIIAEMQALYESEKKQQEIKLLHEKGRAQDLELGRNRAITYTITSTLFLVLILAFFIYRNYKQKKEANIILSQKNTVIEQKNKDITDSIEYARTIQEAMLTEIKTITNRLPNSFIFFRPRDIVSGDFYWFHEIIGSVQQTFFIAAADCTGHGVPGALVSMVCGNLLNDAVIKQNLFLPGKILSEVNKGVGNTFKNHAAEDHFRDGMDIVLCKLSQVNSNWSLEYAGAMNSVFIIRNKKVTELRPDKAPIGGDTPGDYQFSNQTFQLVKGDFVYLSSDGYTDQFGGTKGKKFMVTRFRDLLIQLASLSPIEQQQKLDEVFLEWKGKSDQVDDILVIGFGV